PSGTYRQDSSTHAGPAWWVKGVPRGGAHLSRGELCPSGERPVLFGGTLPLFGTTSSFLGRLGPFLGELCPFWDGPVLFWGAPPLFWATSSFFGTDPSFLGRLGPFLGRPSPFWGGVPPRGRLNVRHGIPTHPQPLYPLTTDDPQTGP